MQGHGRIIAPDFCVAHREANSGLSTLNRTKSILSIYHQQRQLQKQRGMCLNDTYPFCQQPLSGNCHSICFSKPVLWTATSGAPFLSFSGIDDLFCSTLRACQLHPAHTARHTAVGSAGAADILVRLILPARPGTAQRVLFGTPPRHESCVFSPPLFQIP